LFYLEKTKLLKKFLQSAADVDGVGFVCSFVCDFKFVKKPLIMEFIEDESEVVEYKVKFSSHLKIPIVTSLSEK
jgi:hypothetical protein